MPRVFEQYGDLAILLILFLEDLGVPMPIPSDVAVLYAGFRLREHHASLVLVLLMFIAINAGATILYLVTRSGGRPLIDRFGRYIHLDHAKLAKAAGWLDRCGITGIMIGRAVPGVRIVTVISCGLFGVPLRRYLIAQFVGVFFYMTVLLGIGYAAGPTAVEYIRLPAISFRLVLLIIIAVVGPLTLRYLNRQTAADDTRVIQTGLTSAERVAADLLAGFGGMIELAAIWTTFASFAGLFQHVEIQRAISTLARWLSSSQSRTEAYLLDYLVIFGLCLVTSAVFFQQIMPRLRIGPRKLGRQTVALWVLALLLVTVMIVVNLIDLYVRRPNDISVWLSRSGPTVLAIIVVGLLGYAYVATNVRRLAIDRFSDDPEVAPSIQVFRPTASPTTMTSETSGVGKKSGEQLG